MGVKVTAKTLMWLVASVIAAIVVIYFVLRVLRLT